jgi:hypothetical protein
MEKIEIKIWDLEEENKQANSKADKISYGKVELRCGWRP